MTRREPLIQKAVRAPSSHNTQPWRFHVAESRIDLYADRTRRLPVNDPADRELTISCGCALLNLRVALAAEGWQGRTEVLPDPDQPDWLAKVSFSETTGTPSKEALLVVGAGFSQILLRLGYPGEKVPASPRRAVEEVMVNSPLPTGREGRGSCGT